MKNIGCALREAYSEKKYYVISIGVAVVIFLLNVLVHNYKLLFSDGSLFFSLVVGFWYTVSPIAFFFLLFLAVFSGVVVSMSLYVLRRQFKIGVAAGSSSFVAGLIAPACPSCALGLLSVVGLGGVVGILPFKGLELGFLAVVVLGWSFIYLSKKIATTVCEIK